MILNFAFLLLHFFAWVVDICSLISIICFLYQENYSGRYGRWDKADARSAPATTRPSQIREAS
jgi:hypothetical protein